MYQFDELEDGLFKIQKKDADFKIGTLSQVVAHMVLGLGFRKAEIDVALDEMSKLRHTSAEFGALKYFMFTFNPDLSKFN
jgi:hypothetical protein